MVPSTAGSISASISASRSYALASIALISSRKATEVCAIAASESSACTRHAGAGAVRRPEAVSASERAHAHELTEACSCARVSALASAAEAAVEAAVEASVKVSVETAVKAAQPSAINRLAPSALPRSALPRSALPRSALPRSALPHGSSASASCCERSRSCERGRPRRSASAASTAGRAGASAAASCRRRRSASRSFQSGTSPVRPTPNPHAAASASSASRTEGLSDERSRAQRDGTARWDPIVSEGDSSFSVAPKRMSDSSERSPSAHRTRQRPPLTSAPLSPPPDGARALTSRGATSQRSDLTTTGRAQKKPATTAIRGGASTVGASAAGASAAGTSTAGTSAAGTSAAGASAAGALASHDLQVTKSPW